VSNCEQFRDVIEAYALGALDAEERAAFEAHLATDCGECAKKVEEARWLVSQLAYAAPEAAPSEMLKGRLLKTVRAEAPAVAVRAVPAEPQYRFIPRWMWATLAALLVFSVYETWYAGQLERQVRETNTRMASLQGAHREAEQQLMEAKCEAMIMSDPASHNIALWGEHAHPETLEAKWHEKYGLCVMGNKVPMPSRNHVLQVWFIPKEKNAKPMPSMVVKPDANGKLMFVIANPPEAMDDTKSIAITEEPEGGSGWPTTPILWSGNVT
jgi:anti-sigma-K factor RskA